MKGGHGYVPLRIARQVNTAQIHCADARRGLVSNDRQFSWISTATDLKWDGINQWPALTGKQKASEPRTIYIATRNAYSLRHGDWKLIVNGQGESQLFNIAADPYEKTDLAKTEPTRVADLKKLLAAQQSLDQKQLPVDLKGQPE